MSYVRMRSTASSSEGLLKSLQYIFSSSFTSQLVSSITLETDRYRKLGFFKVADVQSLHCQRSRHAQGMYRGMVQFCEIAISVLPLDHELISTMKMVSGFLCVALFGVASVFAQDTPTDIAHLLNSLPRTLSMMQNTTQQLSFEDLQHEEFEIPRRTPAPTPRPAPTLAPWNQTCIGHSQVRPFAQPKPVTISEKVAIDFKPQLDIVNGCHPYPAVNQAGETSCGLWITGAPSGECKGSPLGSQVYGRSAWHQDVWAIVYCWYFPKDSPWPSLGHRHDWEHVIVWLDDPAVKTPRILAVTPSAHGGYSKNVPPRANTVSGTSAKLKYQSHWPFNHALKCTSKDGEFQDLIMWDQLTEKARRALNCVSWGKANVPISDARFRSELDKAWPF